MYIFHLQNTVRRLHGTDFYASIIERAEPKQHEVEIAKQLAEKGYTVLFTPENTFIKGVKNPENKKIRDTPHCALIISSTQADMSLAVSVGAGTITHPYRHTEARYK
ncbi:MAG: hypothetical protein ACTTH7_09620 [Treponema sp.]